MELNHIIKILKKDYALLVTAARVHELLKRHIGKGTIIKEHKMRTSQERKSFQPKILQFYKNF